MPVLSLQNQDARIVYLATVYHLGRPGSETDAVTLERHDLGLASVRETMEQQIDLAAVELELSDYQLGRVGEALLGVINELKQYELAGGRTAVPGFGEAMARAFPEVSPQEPGSALDIVGQAMMLRRRLDAAVGAANESVREAREQQLAQMKAERKPWWKVWRR